MTNTDLAEGPRDKEGNPKLAQSFGLVLLFILERKGLHTQEIGRERRCAQNGGRLASE